MQHPPEIPAQLKRYCSIRVSFAVREDRLRSELSCLRRNRPGRGPQPPDQRANQHQADRDQLSSGHQAPKDRSTTGIISNKLQKIPGHSVEKQISAKDLAV